MSGAVRVMTVTGVLAAALALPAAAQRGTQAPMERAEGREAAVLSVSGAAEVQAAPDQALVRLGVSHDAASAQAAQDRVSAVAQAILKAVTAAGIPPELVQTGQLSLFPVYAPQRAGGFGGEEPQRVVGYRAANTVSIRVTRLALTGPVIDAGLKAGANQLEGVHFSLRDDVPARTRALKAAVAEARQKARAIAEELDVRLLGVLEVQEGGVSVRAPMMGANLAMARAEVATPVSPGQVTLSASVTLRYRIQSKP